MKDPLFVVKLSGAALTAALIFFGLPIGITMLSGGHGGGHHGGEHHDANNPLSLAYPIAFAMEGAGPAEPEPEIDLGTLLSAASVAKGERSAAICKSCHTLDKGGSNGTGPNLYGVIGRTVASSDGFGYTSALNEFGGEWTYERLDAYLENSKSYIPGTSMAQKIRKPEKRADILAYLQTLSDAPVAFPAAAVVEEIVEEAADAIEDAAEEVVTDVVGEILEQTGDE